MSTPYNAPYKVAQRAGRWLTVTQYPSPRPNAKRRARKASGLSARQWKRKVKADRRAIEPAVDKWPTATPGLLAVAVTEQETPQGAGHGA